MANQVTATRNTGFLGRIMNAILGVPVGLLLIAVGIGVLYWNEGRYDLSKLAKKAVEMDAAQPAPAGTEGQLVAAKGTVTSPQMLGDTFLKPGSYLTLERVVEMYAWVEKSETSSQDNLGGSQTTTTTYNYSNEWVEQVPDSSNFKEPAGHQNPAKPIDSSAQKVAQANIGNYQLDPATMQFPAPSNLPLAAENAIPSGGFVLAESGQYLYKGANFNAPQVGDLRISYRAVNSNFNGVVLGKLSGSSIGTFTDEKNHSLYRLFAGSKADAVNTLHQEYRTMLWLFRGGGFLAIWIGLMMVLGPLTAIAHFLPTLGKITGAVVGTIAFPVALLLAGVTIIIGMIAHNPVALAVSLIAAVGVSIWFIRRRGQKMGLKTA
jgi:hypothetical protein